MKTLRLAWEPINQTPLSEIESRFRDYMQGKGKWSFFIG